MARKTSFTHVEGYSALSQSLLADHMVAISVEAKAGKWDADTKMSVQKTDVNGTPQWIVQTLFYPIAGDISHTPEVVPVTIAAAHMPEIVPGEEVEFVGLGAWTYLMRNRDNTITGVGRSFVAQGLRQPGVE